MSSDYEKQLEEANQRLREQLEMETERADKLEKKLKQTEITSNIDGIKNETKAYQEKIMKDMYKSINESVLTHNKLPKFIFQNEK